MTHSRVDWIAKTHHAGGSLDAPYIAARRKLFENNNFGRDIFSSFDPAQSAIFIKAESCCRTILYERRNFAGGAGNAHRRLLTLTALPGKDTAMHHRLRIFDADGPGPMVAEPNVNVRFGEVLTALTHAMRCNRTWLNDFEDDEIQVPSDLYEVISAYTHLRPGA